MLILLMNISEEIIQKERNITEPIFALLIFLIHYYLPKLKKRLLRTNRFNMKELAIDIGD